MSNKDTIESIRKIFASSNYGYVSPECDYADACQERAEVRDARIEFQRDRSIKLEERAVAAVRRLGWMDTKTAVDLRGCNLLDDYWTLTTENSHEHLVCLIAPCDPHPKFAPRERFLPVLGAPVDGEIAINRLADWYGSTPGTMRKWLKDAITAAKEELGECDDLRGQYLRRLLTAKLPESGDR